MQQMGFANGINEEDENEITRRIADSNPDFRMPGAPQEKRKRSPQELLTELQELRRRQGTPEAMGQQASRGANVYMPQLATALSKLVAQAGSIGGQVADTSVIDRYNEAMARANANRESQARQSLAARERALDKQEAGYRSDIAQEATKGYRADQLALRDKELTQKQTLAGIKAQEAKENKQAAQARRDASIAATKDYRDQQLAKSDRSFEAQEAKRKADKEWREANRAPTQNQAKAGGYGRRVEAAINIFDELEKGGYDRTAYSQGVSAALSPEFSKSSELKQQEQSELNFVNAILRQESGAAIGDSEFVKAEKQYFPRAGDSPQVLRNKEQNRNQLLANFKAEAGWYWDKVPAVPYSKFERGEDYGPGTAMAAGVDEAPEFEIGEVKEVNGEKWEYVGNDEWEVLDEAPEPIPEREPRSGNLWRR